ncbi:MAG: hypothetical protein K8F36_06735 [Melioribacteraceae bacterium]|nr:hypothetical protein [Melioribacteraceae bacterium]
MSKEELFNLPKTFISGLGELKIEKFLGKGKSGLSLLASVEEIKVVLKLMHNEVSPFYSFTDNKVKLEKEAYSILSGTNIKIPKLLEANEDKNYLIKEYVDGIVASEIIAKNMLNDKIIEQLFVISEEMLSINYNIDYFPDNFVVKENSIFYIDYELNNYDPKWNLENWGIYYWANNEGMKNFIKTRNAAFINSDPGRGIPIKEPLAAKVKTWIDSYSKNDC